MSLDLYRERHGVDHDPAPPLETAERGIAACVAQIDELHHENTRLREENAALHSLNEELSLLVGLRPPPITRAVLADPDEQIGFWAG